MLERDHPVIENMMRTGYPDRKTPKSPVCPICDSRCDEIYIDKTGEISGCDNCIKTADPGETEACPVCQKPCDTVYLDKDDVLGCPECVKIEDAWTHEELYQPD